MAVDELVYVVSGGGATTLWSDRPGAGKHTFEWTDRGMFLVPPNRWRRFFEPARRPPPVRLMSYDYLPLAMSVVPDPEFFLGNPYVPRSAGVAELKDMFSQATLMPPGEGLRWFNGKGKGVAYWYGNLFPDMSAWDELDVNTGRGAGGRTVRIQFAGSDMSCHMSVFDARTYRERRTGTGRVGSSSSLPARATRRCGRRAVSGWSCPGRRRRCSYLRTAGSISTSTSAPVRPATSRCTRRSSSPATPRKPADRARDQIEYPDEDTWIRRTFESELAARALSTLMPNQAYADRDYTWA